MTFKITYSASEASRLISAVIIEKRNTIPEIKDKGGDAVKSFIDSQSALITERVIFYKIESSEGSLAGYFSLQVIRYGVATLYQYEIRPAFEQFNDQILPEISNFIKGSDWKYDYD